MVVLRVLYRSFRKKSFSQSAVITTYEVAHNPPGFVPIFGQGLIAETVQKGVSEMAHNPPGFVPIFGQGLMAETVQKGVSGGKRWLKTLKLHKYWPTFSHWSYAEVMSLTSDNVDTMIAATGSSGMTEGAKGRLINCVEKLRKRQTALNSLAVYLECQLLCQEEALDYLDYVVDTPLPTNPHDTLPLAIVLAVIEVYDYTSRNVNKCFATKQMEPIMQRVMTNRVLRSAAFTLFSNQTVSRLFWPYETVQEIQRSKRGALSEQRRGMESAVMTRSQIFFGVAPHECNRKRVNSSDSGFEELDITTESFRNIWPIGENTVMFYKTAHSTKE